MNAAAAQQLAARVAGAADLLDIRMLNSAVKLESLPAEGSLSYGLNMSREVEHEVGRDHFAVRVTFELDVTQPGTGEKGDELSVASMEFELAALYNLVGLNGYEPADEEFEAYAETAATLTLFPYAREYVSDTTTRLGLPKLTLPPHRLPSPWHPDVESADPGDQS